VFYDDEYNYLQHLKDRKVVEHDWSAADRYVSTNHRPLDVRRALPYIRVQLEKLLFLRK
jgi:hypothetical protein